MKKLLIATILGLCLLVLLGDYVCDKGQSLSHFGSPAYKYIQEVRPGTLKQYAGYFASALSTLTFIN